MLMNVIRFIGGIFCWWGVIGYFLVLFLKVPDSKKSAIITVIMSGPLGWALFAIVSLRMRVFN
jgi:hypothetical protein